MTREVSGLSEVADTFDGVLVDQFGVLHDGQRPFPGALECLEALKARGVPVVALTNSGKRAAANLARLVRLGFRADLFKAVISSGELARTEIADRLASGALRSGARVAILSRDADTGPVDGLDVRLCRPEDDADLLVIAGIEPERCDRAGYANLLAPLAARAVPAICANPDLVMYVEGGTAFGAGAVAADYAAAGGAVTTVGKPAAPMFAAALSALGDIPPSRVLMIGDSPDHDIAGAARAGCPTLLIKGGAQAGLDASEASPTYAMDRLVWEAGHGC